MTITTSGGPLDYSWVFGIPQGAQGAPGVGTPGVDGIAAFAPLSSPGFVMPAIGSNVNITTSTSFKWAAGGECIWIEGAGTLRVASDPAAPYTSLLIRNPGAADGFASGVTGNVAPGTGVGSLGTPAQVTPSGRPAVDGTVGPTGPQGPVGVPSFIGLTTTIPTLPPGPGLSTVFYTDSLVTPTVFKMYVYTSLWTAGPNIIGAPGTLFLTTPGDPNVTLPTGPVGTLALRTDVPSVYLKVGTTTWTLQASLVATFAQVAVASGNTIVGEVVKTDTVVGYEPFADTHAAPGTYTFDLQYQGVDVAADKALELDWDATNYADSASWLWSIENTDPSSINLTYAAGRFYKKTGLSLPATLAAGAVQVYHVVKTPSGITIQDTYVTLAV